MGALSLTLNADRTHPDAIIESLFFKTDRFRQMVALVIYFMHVSGHPPCEKLLSKSQSSSNLAYT